MSKRKILLMSDDLRMSSGVGTVSREVVFGTLDHYDWFQIGGAINHPEEGKLVDLSEELQKDTGIKDAYLKVFPVSGYGNQELIRDIIADEKPDAILHYTDPRFWSWLYQMEHEIRQQMPIFYYNVWDDLPYPMYNQFFYESCDLIMNLSKQTWNIVNNCAVKKPRTDWDCTYIPHGINDAQFYKITELYDEWNEFESFRNNSLKNKDIEFIVLFNSRNIRRKVPGDVVLSYKTFCDMLPKEKAEKCALVMHTQPVDQNGTDLPALVSAVCPDYKVFFSEDKLDNKHMNFLYNMADVTMLISSNEGFGLSPAESHMAETPTILNVTGGMQDQCGFRLKGELLLEKHYSDIHSLHDDRKWKNNPDLTYGEWVKPVWPSNRSLVGSVPTPYIFDDRCRFDDVAERIKEWYDTPQEERERCGALAREYVMDPRVGQSVGEMCRRFKADMDRAFDKWKPRKRFTLFET